MIFVQDSLGAQEADTVQHVISAAGAPQDTLGSRVDLQAVSETVTGYADSLFSKNRRWVGYDTVGMLFCFCVCVGTQQEVSVATGERFYVTS